MLLNLNTKPLYMSLLSGSITKLNRLFAKVKQNKINSVVDQAKGNSDTSAAESGSEAEETTTPRQSTSLPILPNRNLDPVDEEVTLFCDNLMGFFFMFSYTVEGRNFCFGGEEYK